jgi:Na+-driven multidrug efflux pump
MMAEQHNKILAYALLAHSLILSAATVILVSIFKDFIIELLSSKNAIQNMLSLSFMVMAVGIAVLGIILVFPQFLGGLMLFRKNNQAKIWGIAACIFAIVCVPLGTIIGIYGLWFLTSGSGKNFYSDVKGNEIESNSII